MIEQNIRRFADAARYFNAREWGAYAELLSEALLMRAPGLEGIGTGRDVRLTMARRLVAAFPDGRVETERSFGHSAWACLQLRFQGTHTGQLATSDGGSIPPTGNTVRLPCCLVVRFGPGGDAVEIDEYFDRAALLQLGGVTTGGLVLA